MATSRPTGAKLSPAADRRERRKEFRGLRPVMAHCHLGLGALSRRAGTRQEAREHTRTAGEMDMRFWRDQAETEMGKLP